MTPPSLIVKAPVNEILEPLPGQEVWAEWGPLSDWDGIRPPPSSLVWVVFGGFILRPCMGFA